MKVLTWLRPPRSNDVDPILRVRLVRVGALVLLELVAHCSDGYRVDVRKIHFSTHFQQEESEKF